MDIRRFFSVQTSKSSSDANAGSLKKENQSATKGKSQASKARSKDGAKRKISKSSESEEETSKNGKRKAQSKKKKQVIESDSEEEPLPTKIRKKSQESGEKPKKQKASVICSDEEEALPPRLQTAVKNSQEKKPSKKTSVTEKSPVKVVTNVSEYFGNKPVERSVRKSQKRKERAEDVCEEDAVKTNGKNNNEDIVEEKVHEKESLLEKPAKKAKKGELKSPSKSENTSEEAKKKLDEATTTPLKSSSKEQSLSTPKSDVKQSLAKSLEKLHAFASGKNSETTKPSSSKKNVTPVKEHSSNKTTHSNVPSKISPGKKTPSNGETVTPEKLAPTAKSSTPSSVKGKKPSPSCKSVTPETPKTEIKSTPKKAENKVENADVIPSSLERKSSAYRSFMMREGPQALGSKEIPTGSESCLAGKVFVITGVLESIERDDAVDLIKRYAGKVTQAVSKKTSFLVVGRDPGVSKMEKAKQVGTKQIDEDGLFEMIRATQPTANKSDEKDTKNESSQELSQYSERSESQTSLDQCNSQSSVFSSASSTPATQTPTASPLPAGTTSESLLWVDKYKPKTLKNIIGQQGDKSNVKKLLRWLQNWHENQKSGKPKGAYFAGKEDGSIFKAALLSGPPGVGKTTSAHLVCKEVGFSFVEFNASDSRSKKTLEQHISELLNNKTMDGYFCTSGPKEDSGRAHALIMDEVDGMAGNEDRGGMQELINLIKSTKIPIICMCNDRNSQKVRSLANYCFDLRFHRPKVDQIKGAMMSIACKEGLKISPQAMEKIVVGANQDVRQVLHNLSMWTSRQKSMSYDEAKADAVRAQKDIKLGPFDVTRKIFSAEESSKMKIQDQFSLFFNDYSLIPLFSQENYLQVVPYSASGDMKKILKCVSDSAESYCNSDLVEKCIRSNGSWNLLPLQAFFSCVLPGSVMRGRMTQRIDFPCWLGKNSSTTKNSRILQELVSHAQLSISGSKNELNLEYIPHLRNVLSRPLINATTEDCSSKVSEVIQVMDSYHFVKEDWDSIMEVGQFHGKRKPQEDIISKVKAAFTRTYNKGSHLTPYASNVGAKKKSKKAAGVEAEELGTGETPDVSDDDSDDDTGESFRVKKGGKTGGKKSGKAPATSDSKQARGKGPGKGKGKSKK